MTRGQKIYGGFLAVGVLVVFLISWVRMEEKTPEEVGLLHRVGVLVPPESAAVRQGVQAAAAEHRVSYPRTRLELEVIESDGSEAGVQAAYQQLQQGGKFHAVLTATDAISLAAQPLTMRDGMLQMAVATLAKAYRTNDDLAVRLTTEKITQDGEREAYLAMQLIGLAFEHCGRDNGCIRDYFLTMRDYPTVFGALSFDQAGDPHYK